MILSIVTINFNNISGLRKTIESVISQSWKEFEWVVVDGGSTDGSKELIEEYALRGDIHWWCSEKDNGIYNALNKGIKHCHGGYIQFLNSGDSLYCRDILKNIFNDCSRFYEDIIYGDVMLCNKQNQRKQEYPSNVTIGYFYWNTINHQASFIKRSLLNKLGNYDERYAICSDWKFWLLACINGATFYHVNQIVVYSDLMGISSMNADIVNRERKEIIRNLIPSCYYNDLDYIKQCNFELLMYPELDLLKKKYLQRRIYRKILSIVLFCLSCFDQLENK